MPASCATLGPDGSYRLTALPGPGVVLVAASPRDAYAVAWLPEEGPRKMGGGGLTGDAGSWIQIAVEGHPWQRSIDRYNAVALINPDEDTAALTVDLALHPAPGLAGRVVGPDGEPLAGARVCGLTSMPDPETLSGASFTVEGLNPRRPRELFFLHAERGLGKCVTVPGDRAEPLLVRLDPFGWVTGRMVDRRGQPVPGVGTVWSASPPGGLNSLVETDGAGRFRAGLIPGRKHSLHLSSFRRLLTAVDDIEVGPGCTKDGGDILLSENLVPKPVFGK